MAWWSEILRDLRWAVRALTAGLVLGVAAALTVGATLSGLLFRIPVWDPTSLLMAVAVLTAAAFLAAWIPARRATRIDPRSALNAE